MPPPEPPVHQAPTSQPTPDEPRSRKPPARPANGALSPSLKPRISPYWMPVATRRYKAIRASAPPGNSENWPATQGLTAAIRAALQQTFAQTFPNALHNPPLHPSLNGQIEARESYGFEIQIGVFDDETIREGNLQYRGKDKPTDVLSFSPWEGFEFPAAPDNPYIMLGDVVISIETAARQAQELKHNLRAEMAFLAVHGALHLLGYDHDTDSRRRVMFALQDEIVAKVREAKGF